MKSDESNAPFSPSNDEYDAWLRAKIIRARLDPRPLIPHEEVMANATAAISAAIVRAKDRS